MSEKDWFVSQGINFQNNQQQIQPIVTEEYTQRPSELSKKKMQVTASKKNPFGQKTLAGLTIIIFTLSIQFVVLFLSTFTSNDDEVSLEDLKTAMEVELWFNIIIIGLQLIATKIIYDDVRNLSKHLEEDVEIRNSNLNILAQQINKK